ncbi:hypothetical protein KM043_002954 [Ampulex compressa]|nr:hypothetical protein KM043_002954 [Ampulex compressa]
MGARLATRGRAGRGERVGTRIGKATMPEILSLSSSDTAEDYLSSLYEAPGEKWRSFVTGRGTAANRGNFVAAGLTTVTFLEEDEETLSANKVISLRFDRFAYGTDADVP